MSNKKPKHNFKVGDMVYHCNECHHNPRVRYPIIEILGDIIVLEHNGKEYEYPSKYIEKIDEIAIKHENLSHLVGRWVKWRSGSAPYQITRVSNNNFCVVFQDKEYEYDFNPKTHTILPLKIYEEFERAKELLLSEPKKYCFICWALCAVNTGISFDVGDLKARDSWEKFQKNPSPAAKIIQERLGEYVNLTSWVAANVGYRVFNAENGNTKSMKATRLAWLDSLIAEFRAKDE